MLAAAVFRTRIEMRQIGVRDEAKLIGGFGLCGKELCCAHQIEEFDPVSIRMAKEQNLNLNSLKISGICGRLLCCLGYEYPVYREINEDMPSPGNEIVAGDKICTVHSADTLKESLQVRDGDRFITIARSDLERRGDRYFIKKEVFERLARRDEENSEE